MYVGHATWVTPLVFGGVFLIRYLVSPRRRQGHHGAPQTGSSFAGGSRPVSDRKVPGPDPQARTGTDPAWFRDPFVRHEQRFWSGTEWTDHVTDNGIPSIDPPPKPPKPPEPPVR